LRGADVSQLRKQLVVAEKADDRAAIIELSRRIVAIAPNDTAIWEKLAHAQFAIEDYDRCEQTLQAWQKAIKPPPTVIEDFRGDIAVKIHDYPAAERHWLAFIATKPPPGHAAVDYDNLADLCVEQSRWTDNLNYRSKAIASKDSVTRRVYRACAFLRLHQWDAAYADMDKANKTDSANSQVREWLPQFERLQGFLPQIRALDAQIAKSPNDSALLLDRARLFTLAERPLLALDDCERAMKLQPASMRARIQTAEALFDVSRPDDAAKLQVSSNLARDKDKHVSDQALRELGNEDTQIAQNSGNPDPLAVRAKTLRDLRQIPLALADARAALAIDDKLAAAHFEAAHDLDALDQSKEALIHAVQATELNPNDGAAWQYRGVLEAKRADFPAAIESQTRSLKISESLEALRAREDCERRIGKIDNANADLKRIGELEPPKE
jgi:tetratricopeptide (TPR) repeat protein